MKTIISLFFVFGFLVCQVWAGSGMPYYPYQDYWYEQEREDERELQRYWRDWNQRQLELQRQRQFQLQRQRGGKKQK